MRTVAGITDAQKEALREEITMDFNARAEAARRCALRTLFAMEGALLTGYLAGYLYDNYCCDNDADAGDAADAVDAADVVNAVDAVHVNDVVPHHDLDVLDVSHVLPPHDLDVLDVSHVLHPHDLDIDHNLFGDIADTLHSVFV